MSGAATAPALEPVVRCNTCEPRHNTLQYDFKRGAFFHPVPPPKPHQPDPRPRDLRAWRAWRHQ